MSNPRVHVAALSPTTQTPPPRPTTHPPTYATTVNPAWMPLSWDANTQHLWSAGILRAAVGGGGLLRVNRRNGQRPQHTWCNKCARVTRVWARQRRLAKWPEKCARAGFLAYSAIGIWAAASVQGAFASLGGSQIGISVKTHDIGRRPGHGWPGGSKTGSKRKWSAASTVAGTNTPRAC